jgi:hypothetical protein
MAGAPLARRSQLQGLSTAYVRAMLVIAQSYFGPPRSGGDHGPVQFVRCRDAFSKFSPFRDFDFSAQDLSVLGERGRVTDLTHQISFCPE